MKKFLAYFYGGIVRFKTVILVMAILVVVYWIPFFIILFANRPNIVDSIDQLPVSDAVIVFGANINGKNEVTPLLKERLDAGKAIFDDGKAKTIVVSNTTVAADVMQKYLQGANVSADSIVVDSQADKTTDTCIYEKKQHPENRTIVFVSQGFHLPRLVYQCKKIGINGIAFSAESLRVRGGSDDSVLTVAIIRISRYLREAGLTWLAILNIYR